MDMQRIKAFSDLTTSRGSPGVRSPPVSVQMDMKTESDLSHLTY